MKLELLYIVGLVLLFSCGKTTSLENEDLNWQPYQIGDSLEFTSSKGERFSLVIDTITRNHSVTDPLDIIPNRTENCRVIGVYSLINPWVSTIGDTVTEQSTPLLNLNSGLEQPSIRFYLIIEDSWFYGISWFEIRVLNNKKCSQFSTYNDVLVFEDLTGEYRERENQIERFYWSKEFGYIRYELKEGYFWQLEKFNRNGKNIINKDKN
jgi:hypothetical protein